MKVAVVILNWNGQNFLRQFLPSVIRHSGDAEIFVADNGSTDDSCAMLDGEFPSVKQVLNGSNLGFAGGYNAALRKINADYFILLNSDVEVTENWIDPVIRILEEDQTIAACQPKVLSHADKTSFEYAGAAGGFIDKFGYPFCRGRIFNSVEKDTGQYDDTRRIFWATGACLFMRASEFKKVNGFDEAFFAHMEEIDLCWRLQHAGGTIWYCPGSVVYHVGGGTLHKSNPFKTYLNFRNNLLMLYKNLPEAKVKKVLMTRKNLDFLAALKFLLSGDLRESWAVWRAYRDFRKMKNQATRLSDVSGIAASQIEAVIYPFSILKEYYLKGKRFFRQLDF